MNRDDFIFYLLKIKLSAAEEIDKIIRTYQKTNESPYWLLDKLEYDICFIDSIISNLPEEE